MAGDVIALVKVRLIRSKERKGKLNVNFIFNSVESWMEGDRSIRFLNGKLLHVTARFVDRAHQVVLFRAE